VECKRRQSGGEYIIGSRLCALESMGHSVAFETCVHRTQHLIGARYVCTPSPASRMHLDHLHAVPGVSDPLGVCARRSWHPRHIWNTCTPSSASQNACTPSLAAQTRLYRLNAIYGVSDASITPAHRSQRLGRICDGCTPLPASQTHL
jgi:hypothetical protein